MWLFLYTQFYAEQFNARFSSKKWPPQDISYLLLDPVNGFSADIDN